MEQATLNGPVLVRGFIKGLSRGSHGFHIHTKGQLGNKCKDAGSHFNPFKARFFLHLYFTMNFLKFGFSEKVTKFEKIFVVLLTRASCSVRATAYLSKSQRRFFKTNVVKSYYTNFNICLL